MEKPILGLPSSALRAGVLTTNRFSHDSIISRTSLSLKDKTTKNNQKRRDNNQSEKIPKEGLCPQRRPLYNISIEKLKGH